MSENTKEYKEYYVAFLDILGFKEIVNHKTCAEIYSLFECIKSGSHTNIVFNGEEIDAFEKIQHKIMSDSIVLYIDASLDDAFFSLLFACQTLQMCLLARESPVLLRGGIACGALFSEADVIFGKGLTEAYLIESNIAKYPRIVFNNSLLEQGRGKRAKISRNLENWVLACDQDELNFVNFFGRIYRFGETDQYLSRILNMCESVLNNSYEASLREKYLWLKNITLRVANNKPLIEEN